MDRGRFQSGDPTPGGSQDVLVSLPVGNALYGSGGLARQRLSPYLFSTSVCPCARGAAGLLFSFPEFSNSTQGVSEWRCHRHEYRADL